MDALREMQKLPELRSCYELRMSTLPLSTEKSQMTPGATCKLPVKSSFDERNGIAIERSFSGFPPSFLRLLLDVLTFDFKILFYDGANL